jgi:hypothetical protein
MSPDDAFDSELLDLHLGLLSEAQRRTWEQRIAADPHLAEQHAALGAVFAALRSSGPVQSPLGLAGRVMARVEQAGPPLQVLRPVDELTRVAERANGRVIRLGNLRDIVAVAAMIVLMVGVGVPGVLNMRERNQRMGCSQNLARLGQGLQQYATTYGSSFPFAGWASRASWRPSSEPGVVMIPNHRHLYPLLRGAFVREPRMFVCPARSDVPMPLDQVRGRDDFLESRNISYAYQNMAGVRPSLGTNPALPLVGDDNPLFEDGVPLLDRLGLSDPSGRNSPAHRGAGQNILLLDGHLEWSTNPYAGIDGDNIWTLQGVQSYTGREGPASSTDSQLLK